MKFKFLDHPADLKIQAFGKDLEELFANATLGMMTYLYPKNVDIVQHETKTEIRLRTSDLEALLVDWLSELLYFSDTRDVCYNEFEFRKLENDKLIAVAWGRRVQAKEDIKAVTYHGLEIKEIDSGWTAIILFDI